MDLLFREDYLFDSNFFGSDKSSKLKIYNTASSPKDLLKSISIPSFLPCQFDREVDMIKAEALT